MLCDEQAELGGSLLRERTADRRQAGRRVGRGGDRRARGRRQCHAAAAHDGVRLISGTTCSVLSERVTDHLAVPADRLPRERLWQVRAEGGRDRDRRDRAPAGFPGNDRPGIMLAEAARTYVNRYARTPGGNAGGRSRRTMAPIGRRWICRRTASRSLRSRTCGGAAGPLDRPRLGRRDRRPDRRRSSPRRGDGVAYPRRTLRQVDDGGRAGARGRRSPAIWS